MDVRIILEATREPVAALLRGALEIALVSSPVRDRDLVSVPLFEDEWTLMLLRTRSLRARMSVLSSSDVKHSLRTRRREAM